MITYHISYSYPAERYLKKIKDKSLLASFKSAIDRLNIDPYIGVMKTGDLHGIYCYDVSTLRTMKVNIEHEFLCP